MIFIRFLDSADRARWGVRTGEDSARTLEAAPWLGSTTPGPEVAVKRLLAPAEPPNIFGIGLNYRKHAEEGGKAVPTEPLVFLKATSCVIGPGDAIVLPRSAQDEVDFEAELVVVIGKRARDIAPADALPHVFGYTCGNDVSARDCQRRRDGQWSRAKGFDTFGPVGPWIVTADAFDPSDTAIGSRLNGERMQDSRTSDMVFSCAELVSYLSRQFTLLPGTLIFTGTPPGVGFARKPPRFLRAGDEITIEIAGIGSLSNHVMSSPPKVVG